MRSTVLVALDPAVEASQTSVDGVIRTLVELTERPGTTEASEPGGAKGAEEVLQIGRASCRERE